MEGLFGEFERRVGAGEITWKEILNQINLVKKIDYVDEDYSSRYSPYLNAFYIGISSMPGRTLEADTIQSSHFTSPYEFYRRKELWNHLSKDALAITEIIFDSSPDDWRRGKIGAEIYTATGLVSKSKLHTALRRRGWEVPRIKRSFSELKRFCCELGN